MSTSNRQKQRFCCSFGQLTEYCSFATANKIQQWRLQFQWSNVSDYYLLAQCHTSFVAHFHCHLRIIGPIPHCYGQTSCTHSSVRCIKNSIRQKRPNGFLLFFYPKVWQVLQKVMTNEQFTTMCTSNIKLHLSWHPHGKRGHSFKRWTITLIYSKLADGGYLRVELIMSKPKMQRAEQMTFTRVWPRWLITNFHKVARLVCQADTAHKNVEE